MLNHLTLGQSLIKRRLDVPSQRSKPQHYGEGHRLSWFQHHVADFLRPQPRR